MDPIEPWVDCEELRRMADSLLAAPPPADPQPADATYGDEFVGYAGEDAPADESAPPPRAGSAPGQEGQARPGHDQVSAPSTAEQNARQALAAARDIAQRGGLLAGAGDPPDAISAEPTPATEREPSATPPGPAELTHISPVPAGSPAAPSAPAPSARPDPPGVVTATAPAPARTPFLARLQAYGTWLREGTVAKAFFVIDREGEVLIDEVQSPKLQQVARTLAQASRTANRQAGAAAVGNLHIKVAPDTILEVVPVLTRCGPLILGIIVQQPLTARNVEAVARGLQQVIDSDSGGHSP